MSADRPVLVLTHVPHEGPGLIAAALDHPIMVRTVARTQDPRLPTTREIAGLVVMGGPMDADDDEHFPGLVAERRLLAEATEAGLPVLGVCLGAQLLGLALGGTLVRRGGTEVGFAPLDVLVDDPLLAPLGPSPDVLHWHQDQVSVPAGATILASTPTTPAQAFRAGTAVGLQFHLEVDQMMLDLWLSIGDGMLDADDVARIRSDGARVLPTLVPAALAALGVLAEQVRATG
jgi:GMP synthase (glutamine-hydrolysing)